MELINNNQVPEGYKKTEVGVIPEDWEVKTIGDVADVKTGPFGSVLHERDYVKDGTPIITVEHLGEFGVEYFNLPMVSDQDKNRLKSYSLKVGDIVFSRVGSIDRNALIKESESGWLFSGRLLRIRLNNQSNQSHYFSYHFHSAPFKQRVREVAVGQTMPSLNTRILKAIKVVLPPIEEQEAIAQTLSDVDVLIDALDKLIAKKRNIKTATMQQLLTGKTRLPGFDGEWLEKQIGTEIDLLTGYPFPSSKYSDSGIRLLRCSNIKRGVTDWDEALIQYWSEITPDLRQYVLDDGDIVVAMDGSLVGRSFAQLSKLDLPALLLQRVARIRSDKIDISYLKEWICSIFFTEYCDSIKTVTAIPHISPEDIRNFKIKIPPTKEEQKAIAKVLSDIDSEITALEKRRAKTQAIKQGMMQELLTGRTRLINN